MQNKFAAIISCFGSYENRIKFIDEYFQKKGYKTVIVFSDFDHHQKKHEKKWGNLSNAYYIPTLSYNKNLSVKRLRSHATFANDVCSFLETEKPDLVYSLIPPNSLVKKISLLKEKLRFSLIYDVIDLWPESLPGVNEAIPPLFLWRNYRDNYINYADCVVMECSYYRDVLKNNVDEEKLHLLYPMKPAIKTNDISEVVDDCSKIKLGYLGSINNLIDIDTICECVKACTCLKPVEFHIVGCGNKIDEFINKLETLGASVINHGAIYDTLKKAEILGNCHFGINVYKKDVKIGLTLKSIDYFQCGLPIINNISGDTEKMVRDYNVGVNLSETNQIPLESMSPFIDEPQKSRQRVLSFFDKVFSSEFSEDRLSFLEKYI